MATGSAARHHRDCALRAVNGDEICLDNIRLFAKLPGDAKGELLDSVVHSSYPQGSIVVHEGDPIDSILIVHKGRIKTFRVMQDGEERVLDVLHDGQAIWHGMFLEDHVYHYSVGCLSDVQFCSIKRTAFEKVLERHPDVALSLIQMLSTELDEAEERAALLSVHNPRVRLAGFLLYREFRNKNYKKVFNEASGSNGQMPAFVKIAIWIVCAVLYVLQVLPLAFRLTNAPTGEGLLWLGIVLSVLGLILESAADLEKSALGSRNGALY